MTLLTKFHSLNLSEVEGMNLLQDFGIVSDNAVYVADVCESDQVRAIEFLNEKAHRQPPTKPSDAPKP